MGRRPAASRNQEIAQMAAGPIASSKRVEVQLEVPGSETMNQKLETSHRLMEKRNSKLPLQDKDTGTSSRKRPKCNAAPIRRSLRIQNGAVFAGNKSIAPVAEEILTISETENETESETEPQIEREDEQPPDNVQGSFSHEKSMEEKLDRVVKLLEAMNSKRNNMRNKSYAFSESPNSTYESLHADSQKIESLTKENRELSLKLNVALAEIEGYNDGSRAASEMFEKLKDVIIISNMAKTTEAALNLSSQAAGEARISHSLIAD